VTETAARPAQAAFDAAPIVAAALIEAARLDQGPCPPSYLALLDTAFESAASAALADPALLQRSLRLRRIARRLLPEPLHPVARRAAALADAAARRSPALLALGHELAALAEGAADDVVAMKAPARRLVKRADAAVRSVPALHEALRRLARLTESAASAGELPAAVRRTARLALLLAQRTRSLR